MSAKEILKPASKLLISELNKRGILLKSTISYQLISAAYGFWSHESLVDFKIPFEPFNRNFLAGAKPQFHNALLCERIDRLLNLGDEKPQDIAYLIMDLLTYHYPLRVQALKVLYEVEYEHTRALIFKLLRPKNNEPTALASIAISMNELPALPACSLAGHLRLLRNARMMIDEKIAEGHVTVAEFVNQGPTWIWCYPSPFVKEASPSLADAAFRVAREEDDWTFPRIKHQTEIGIGFVLLQIRPRREVRTSYAVVSGRYKLEIESGKPKWSALNVLCITRDDVTHYRQQALPEVLGHEVDELPLVSHCPVCGDLQATARDNTVFIRCSCSPI
jgi:hypothetical protein